MNHEKSIDESETVLFIDDHYITRKKNIKRQFHSPSKCSDDPFFYSTQVPWDTSPLIFGTVAYDPLNPSSNNKSCIFVA